MSAALYALNSAEKAIKAEIEAAKDDLCSDRLPTWEDTIRVRGQLNGLERALAAVQAAKKKDHDDDE